MSESTWCVIAGIMIGFSLGINLLAFVFKADVHSSAGEVRVMIEKCEVNLPRNQTCKLFAIPRKETK
jgi:hypothetical protein